MKATLFSIIIIFLQISSSSAKFQRKDLDHLCPTINEIKREIASLQSKPLTSNDSETSNDLETFQIQVEDNTIFLKELQNNLSPKGVGAFGKVYVPNRDNKATLFGTGERKAVKLLHINNERTISNLKVQDSVLKEIKVLKYLNSQPNYRYYFSKYFFCTDLTEEIQEIALHSSATLDKTNLSYLTLKANEYKLALEIERMGFSLFEYLSGVSKNVVEGMDITSRIQMAKNLMDALMMMNQKYIHCDIKLENVMLTFIPSENLENMIQEGYPLISTEDNKQLIVKIIDFGASVPFESGECKGGSPGYISPEFFNDGPHTKIDEFAMGMTLIDFELSLMNIPTFSSILSKIFIAKRNAQFKKLKLFDVLQKNLLYNKMVAYLEDTAVNAGAVQYLHKSGLIEDLETDHPPVKEMMLTNINILEATMIHLIGHFLKTDLSKLYKHKYEVMHKAIEIQLEKLFKEAASVTMAMGSQSKTGKELNYFAAHLDVIYTKHKIVSAYFDILMGMIEYKPENRKDSMNSDSELMFLINQYNLDVEIAKTYITKYESPNQSILDTMEDSIRESAIDFNVDSHLKTNSNENDYPEVHFIEVSTSENFIRII